MSTIRWNRLIPLALIPLISCLLLAVFSPGLVRAYRSTIWQNDPVRAAELGHSLIDYTLPAGYRESASYHISGASSILITPADGRDGMTIQIEQVEISMNDQELVTEMEPAWAREVGQRIYTTEHVRAETMLLLGRETTLNYREGTDESGQRVRQLVTVVYGKNGWVVIVLVSPVEKWDPVLVDEFLASVQ
jgi:hypothetical protein